MLSFLADTSGYRYEIQTAGMLLAFFSAWRWGAGPERASVLVFSLLWILDLLRAWIDGGESYRMSVDIWDASIDGVTAIGFVAIALYANRTYTLCLAAFQLISVSGHLMRAIAPHMNGLAYSIISIAPSWLELVTIATGIVLHRRRFMRFGPYRSWRVSSPLLQGLDPGNYPKG